MRWREAAVSTEMGLVPSAIIRPNTRCTTGLIAVPHGEDQIVQIERGRCRRRTPWHRQGLWSRRPYYLKGGLYKA